MSVAVTVREVSSRGDLVGALRVRHAVYATERKWVEETTAGIEQDDLDIFSTHLVALQDDKVIGTARMIMSSPLGFPFSKVCKLPEVVDPEMSYEVSRLAVLPEARGNNSRILVGLCRAMWQVADREGLSHWCAVVDKPVSKLLRRLGFRFVFEAGEIFHLGSLCVPLVCSQQQSRDVLFAPAITGMVSDLIEECIP